MATINDNLLVICQIESAAAVEAIPDIAAVDGVDMLTVGPTDLSGSIGRFAQFDHPTSPAWVARRTGDHDSGRWLAGIGLLGRTVPIWSPKGTTWSLPASTRPSCANRQRRRSPASAPGCRRAGDG
ncbi:MAG: hypothetical protein H6842_11900 [Rhodospirillaceae bacterium]|nr:hypothetical protein [Rhodospirillaceae bacterium]